MRGAGFAKRQKQGLVPRSGLGYDAEYPRFSRTSQSQ
jgi:hypothetical protein